MSFVAEASRLRESGRAPEKQYASVYRPASKGYVGGYVAALCKVGGSWLTSRGLGQPNYESVL